jgi:hypothetical protein
MEQSPILEADVCLDIEAVSYNVRSLEKHHHVRFEVFTAVKKYQVMVFLRSVRWYFFAAYVGC